MHKITGITDYTAFLTGSEVEHAQEIMHSLDLPYSPSLVWDYVTQPETRRLLMGAEAILYDASILRGF